MDRGKTKILVIKCKNVLIFLKFECTVMMFSYNSGDKNAEY